MEDDMTPEIAYFGVSRCLGCGWRAQLWRLKLGKLIDYRCLDCWESVLKLTRLQSEYNKRN